MENYLSRIFAVCFLAIMGFALSPVEKASSAQLSPAGQDAFSRGINAAKQKDFTTALRYFLEAQKTDPDEPQISFNLGLASLKLPDYELRALAWFKVYQLQIPNAQNAADIDVQIKSIQDAFESRIGKMLDKLEPKMATDISASQGFTIAFARNNIGDVAGGLRMVRILSGKDNWQDAMAQFRYEPGLSDSLNRIAKMENDRGRMEFLQDIGSNGLLLFNQFKDTDISEVLRQSKKEKNPEDAFKILLNWVSEATGLYRVINGRYEPESVPDQYLAKYYSNAHYNRGNAYYKKKLYDQAIADYTRAIELNPMNANAYGNRGSIYYGKGQYDQAIADNTKAIELNPTDVIAYKIRGSAYYGKEQYDQAIADFTRALEIDPTYFLAYYNRGTAYHTKGQYDLAIIDFTKAIKLEPKDSFSYNNRGKSREQKKQYELAIADYTKAIETEPQYLLAYWNRGHAYEQKKQYAQAIADYTRAIELEPKDAISYNSRGSAYYHNKQYDQAISDFDKALELDPKNVFAEFNRKLAREKQTIIPKR